MIKSALFSSGILISYLKLSIYGLIVVSVIGCGSVTATGDGEIDLNIQKHLWIDDPTKQKNIFVFLDGTGNNSKTGTNVLKLYTRIVENNAPQTAAIYIAGVGSAEAAPIVESALGHGMEPRILKAYAFISENYNPIDHIYLFGFSRGAHQARALAGLVSYAGVPATTRKDSTSLMDVGNSIIELVKKKSDEDYLNSWRMWKPGHAHPMETEIREKLNIEMQPAQVTFLGLWDTVPGSSLKNYMTCKEDKGFIKKYLYFLIPGVDKGERYKTDSYPPIRQIAHAVSLDEKRSKFLPLLLCKPINEKYTNINEVWFPGAHSDVGGGYGDSDELPNISLAWMMKLLSKSYRLQPFPKITGNATGLAHWSIGDYPANIGSECVDRSPPEGAEIHRSFNERKESSPVPIRWGGLRKHVEYPISCKRKQASDPSTF